QRLHVRRVFEPALGLEGAAIFAQLVVGAPALRNEDWGVRIEAPQRSEMDAHHLATRPVRRDERDVSRDQRERPFAPAFAFYGEPGQYRLAQRQLAWPSSAHRIPSLPRNCPPAARF